jgi:hypothetical protein
MGSLLVCPQHAAHEVGKRKKRTDRDAGLGRRRPSRSAIGVGGRARDGTVVARGQAHDQPPGATGGQDPLDAERLAEERMSRIDDRDVSW